MPYLSLVHLRELRCVLCPTVLAVAGARSFIVDGDGDPVNFDDEHPPAEMAVEIFCPMGHANPVLVPLEVSAEPAMLTPDDAPLGTDAVLVSITAQSATET